MVMIGFAGVFVIRAQRTGEGVTSIPLERLAGFLAFLWGSTLLQSGGEALGQQRYLIAVVATGGGALAGRVREGTSSV